MCDAEGFSLSFYCCIHSGFIVLFLQSFGNNQINPLALYSLYKQINRIIFRKNWDRRINRRITTDVKIGCKLHPMILQDLHFKYAALCRAVEINLQIFLVLIGFSLWKIWISTFARERMKHVWHGRLSLISVHKTQTIQKRLFKLSTSTIFQREFLKWSIYYKILELYLSRSLCMLNTLDLLDSLLNNCPCSCLNSNIEYIKWVGWVSEEYKYVMYMCRIVEWVCVCVSGIDCDCDSISFIQYNYLVLYWLK